MKYNIQNHEFHLYHRFLSILFNKLVSHSIQVENIAELNLEKTT